jgi:hypothetical protein
VLNDENKDPLLFELDFTYANEEKEVVFPEEIVDLNLRAQKLLKK